MGNTAGIIEIELADTSPSEGANHVGTTVVPRYTAGQSIGGNVVVDFGALASRFPGKPLEFAIKLQVVGKEKSKIVQGPSARKAERTLLFAQHILRHVKSEEVWEPQCYHFPFQVEIPSDMPGSLLCQDGSRARRSYGEISYHVRALLDRSLHARRRSSSSAKTLVVHRPIQIQAARIPPIVVPYMMQPTSHKIKTFGVKSKGSVLFGVSVADTHVGPGEYLQWSFACRNHSTVDVQELHVRLVETVSWKLDSTKQIKTAETELIRGVEPMLIPQKRDLWYTTSIEEDIDEREDDFIALHHELKGNARTFRLQVPPSHKMHDDYAGPLLKCKHRLEVRVKTEDHVDDPRVDVPVQLKQFIPLREFRETTESRFFQVAGLDEVDDEVDHSRISSASAKNVSEITCFSISGREDEETAESEEESSNQSPSDHRASSASNAAAEIVDVPEEGSANVFDEDVLDVSQPEWGALAEPSAVQPTHAGRDDVLRSSTGSEIPLSLLFTGGRVRDIAISSTSWSDLSAGTVASSSIFQDYAALPPSFANLLEEMLVSVDDFNIVCRKLEDPEWAPVLTRQTPEEFGTMISHVNIDHDQPRVAAIVAGQIHLESRFSCQHVIHALQHCADWTRTCLVQQLLPLCNDSMEHLQDLTDVLTRWELTVLENDIERALEHSLSA